MTEYTYRRTAVDGASSVTLVIMLYDRLVADLQRAVEAMEHNEIEKRCSELKHALLILQQLEGSLDHENGGVAARNLANFYSYARAKVLEAQIKIGPIDVAGADRTLSGYKGSLAAGECTGRRFGVQ
jgi:flagellar protein FliS